MTAATTSSAEYTVKLESFEGPLDLLLHLVKTNEVDIYHLPIATVTDQYLEYLGMFEELNLDVAGEYLVMAATLMYLKSRLLLPADDEEDEEGIEDPAADLVRQLAEYQRYREVAEELRDRALLGRDVFRRDPTQPDPDPNEEDEVKVVDMGALLEALRLVLSRAVQRKPHTLADEEYHVADAVKVMVERLRSGGRVEFDRLFGETPARGFVIATFVGLLELIKLRVVDVEQDENRGPIFVSLSEGDAEQAMAMLAVTYGPVPHHVHPWEEAPEDSTGDSDSGGDPQAG
jgi:segregation and condensation protein A